MLKREVPKSNDESKEGSEDDENEAQPRKASKKKLVYGIIFLNTLLYVYNLFVFD